jgi:hypothetical protein
MSTSRNESSSYRIILFSILVNRLTFHRILTLQVPVICRPTEHNVDIQGQIISYSLCRTLGPHTGGYKQFCLLGYNAV